MNKCRVKKHIGDNGSTLITVIVAIAFVTILTSIILGTSVMNVRMKSIDRRTKDDFYYAEKALNDIYTGIGQETAKTAADEYEDAFKDVGLSGDDSSFAEKAENTYREMFIAKTAVKLSLPAVSPTPHNMTATQAELKKYVVDQTGITNGNITVKVKDFQYEKYNGTKEDDQAKADRIRLIGVQVTSKDANDFQATVSTDIIIDTPTMDFLGPNVDVTDYCIIANKGLYVNGSASITGNVYAGLHAKDSIVLETKEDDTEVKLKDSDYGSENLYGGINIVGKSGSTNKVTMIGNYIVSKGDINLSGYKPSLTVSTSGGADTNLYFDTMRTCKDSDPTNQKTINLNANIFALNDLELNGDNSKVTIKGNYYGYNDKTLPNPNPTGTPAPDPFASFSATTGHDDADSSAIVINGSHSTLDMSGIRSLVLMGRAYVDFSKEGKDGMSEDGSGAKVAATAEAVALKTNQQLYLVPTDLLEGPNPVIKDDYGSGFKLVQSKKTKEDGTEYAEDKIKDWFGYDFIDQTNPFKTYHVTLSDDSEVYYAYLDFNDSLWVRRKKNVDPWKCKCGEINTANKDYCADDTCKRPAPRYIKYTGGGHLGTGGSVSSMEAFFDIIMNSKADRTGIITKLKSEDATMTDTQAEKEYERLMGSAPSPYTLYSRIVDSMGYKYFDLQDCVIGSASDSTIIYSQNSIVSYETKKKEGTGEVEYDSETHTPIFKKIEKKANNAGMERFAAYPQNLFHRYQWLCTYLNGQEDVALSEDPNTKKKKDKDGHDIVDEFGMTKRAYSDDDILEVKKDWNGDKIGSVYEGYNLAADSAPLGHFVALDRIGESTDTTGNITDAIARGIQKNGYGCFVAKKGDFVIEGGKPWMTGGTFKGVAIVDGNITVKANVSGLLMATGIITVEDGVDISNDKGLIQARIEKELSNVRTFPDSEPDPDSPVGSGLKSYYLINYLTKNSRNTGTTTTDEQMMYTAVQGSKKKIDRIEADYHDFMFYENWQKGPSD